MVSPLTVSNLGDARRSATLAAPPRKRRKVDRDSMLVLLVHGSAALLQRNIYGNITNLNGTWVYRIQYMCVAAFTGVFNREGLLPPIHVCGIHNFVSQRDPK